MKEFIINWAIRIVVGKVLPKLISGSISDLAIDRAAEKYAGIVTDTGQKIAGVHWNDLEDSIQEKINRFTKAFNKKLNYDD